MKDQLISEISKQLNIAETAGTESLCKAIYSATGKMALASIWDHPEDEKFVSIQHFKKRAAQVLDAYLSIYPEAAHRFPSDRSGIIEDIYETYRRNGFFYHSSHRLYPAAPSTGGTGQCSLYRGVPPEKPCYMSGLGLYGVTKAAEHGQSAAEMFELQKQPLSDYLQEVLASNDWNEVGWPEDAEFLRLKPPFSRGYWQEKPDKVEIPSMARYGAPNKLYVFYRWLNGHFEQKSIPSWRVDDFRTIGQPGYGEYRRIACGLLEAAQKLPPVVVKSASNHTVSIKLGYRLPPAEEDFFKLYSWPINFDITQKTPQVFQREMSEIVYPVFKQHLESIGYRFVEE